MMPEYSCWQNRVHVADDVEDASDVVPAFADVDCFVSVDALFDLDVPSDAAVLSKRTTPRCFENDCLTISTSALLVANPC